MSRLALRISGLVVAALVVVVAVQFLLIGFETDPLVSPGRVDRLVNWVEDRPREGPGILVGVALVMLGCWIAWSWAQSVRGVSREVLTTRRRRGWTKIDKTTLVDSFERRLEPIDRRVDADVSVTRRGRVDLCLVTPDVSTTGSTVELREAIDDICRDRNLPCRSGRIVATTPRRMTRRRRVR